MKRLRHWQYTSVVSLTLFILGSFLYEKSDYIGVMLTMLGYFIFVCGLIGVGTFFLSLFLLVKHRTLNTLFFLNILLVLWPLGFFILVAFLVSIGLGPPA